MAWDVNGCLVYCEYHSPKHRAISLKGNNHFNFQRGGGGGTREGGGVLAVSMLWKMQKINNLTLYFSTRNFAYFIFFHVGYLIFVLCKINVLARSSLPEKLNCRSLTSSGSCRSIAWQNFPSLPLSSFSCSNLPPPLHRSACPRYTFYLHDSLFVNKLVLVEKIVDKPLTSR